MKKLAYLLVLLPLLLGCTPSAPSVNIGSTCDSLQPTTGDVQYALNFGRDLFTDSVWSRSYTVAELDAIVSWSHRSISALADISMQLYCNENGTADLELFYNNETLKEKFSNYDMANITISCKSGDIYLYELDAVEENLGYTIRQWVQPLNKTRILSAVVVFPKEEAALMEKYSQSLFPSLPACQ